MHEPPQVQSTCIFLLEVLPNHQARCKRDAGGSILMFLEQQLTPAVVLGVLLGPLSTQRVSPKAHCFPETQAEVMPCSACYPDHNRARTKAECLRHRCMGFR